MSRIQPGQPLDVQQIAAMRQMQANQKRGELYGLAVSLFKDHWVPSHIVDDKKGWDEDLAVKCLEAAKTMFAVLEEDVKNAEK